MSTSQDSGGNPSSAEDKANEGARLLQAGDYRGAIAACTQAIRLNPNHEAARKTRAEAKKFLKGQPLAVSLRSRFSGKKDMLVLAIVGGLLGIFIGFIGIVAFVVRNFSEIPGSFSQVEGPCTLCEHINETFVLTLWFIALSFAGGVLASLSVAINRRFASVVLLGVGGALLTLMLMAFNHLSHSPWNDLSAVALIFGIVPPLIFLGGGLHYGGFGSDWLGRRIGRWIPQSWKRR